MDRVPFQNISCLTFCDIYAIAFERGEKAFIIPIIPPNAPTHIIITITHDPAPSKPVPIRPINEEILSTVPAKIPNISDENIPTPRQATVGIPLIATIRTKIKGIIIYIGTPF